VREGLLRLADEALVEVGPQRGTYVARLALPRIAEALFVREAVECAVLERVIVRADAGRVAMALAAIVKAHEAAMAAGDVQAGADFNARVRTLTIRLDFAAGSRFAVPGIAGEHPVHDTVAKRYRHLNFCQHECFLEVRVPRVPLPDGAVRQIEPPWAGKLSGCTLLFEALVLMLCQRMTFTAAARLVGESRHRVAAICDRYVEPTLAQADFSATHELAIDETSRARGHDYIALAADAVERRVLAVAESPAAWRPSRRWPTNWPAGAVTPSKSAR
jgi:hypothetical protein